VYFAEASFHTNMNLEFIGLTFNLIIEQ
jgi:hypothetical protein